MNISEFHQRIERIWQSIEEQLDEQGCDVDFDTQGAVFSLTFPDRSQIIINKQEPLFELWLASRLGGFHFAYRNERWLNHENKSFWQCLQEACVAHGEQVSFIE